MSAFLEAWAWSVAGIIAVLVGVVALAVLCTEDEDQPPVWLWLLSMAYLIAVVAAIIAGMWVASS